MGRFLELLSDKSDGWSKDVCLQLIRDFLIVEDAFAEVNQGKRASFLPYAFVLNSLLRKQGMEHLFDVRPKAPAKEASLQQHWDKLVDADERLRPRPDSPSRI